MLSNLETWLLALVLGVAQLGLGQAALAHDWDFELSLAGATSHAEEAAQRALFDSFFLRPVFGESDGQLFTFTQGRALSLTARRPVVPLGTRTEILFSGRISYNRQDYFLPDGVDIFTDPADITVRSLSLWPDIGLRSVWNVTYGHRVSTEFAAGYMFSHFETHLRSKLLDVRAKGRDHRAYARVAAARDFDNIGWQNIPRKRSVVPTVRAELYVFDLDTMDLTVGIGLKF